MEGMPLFIDYPDFITPGPHHAPEEKKVRRIINHINYLREKFNIIISVPKSSINN